MPIWKKKRPHADNVLDGLVKARGGITRRLTDNRNIDIPTGRERARRWVTRGLRRQMAGASTVPSRSYFTYTGENRGAFYVWLRDNIPIVSAGVWAWVRLCSTRLSRRIEGAERARAADLLDEFDRRVLEMPYGRGSGIDKLTEGYFLELFTTGRFAGEAVQAEDEASIDHFHFIDPYQVGWIHTDDGWVPTVTIDDDNQERIDPSLFFYGTLGTDLSNPTGVEPLASIPFVAEIEQLMLEDMARSSHNAGTPHLQVKIMRPEQHTWETEAGYVDRANRYFQDVVSEFQNIEPDENIFTWSDVEVTVIGSSSAQTAFRLGREQVIEDVITGLKLFPWVLGRTHKTTQNWVQSQFDLLMEMVESHQKSGADLADWICNLELQRRGVKAWVRHSFAGHPDPFALERVRAEHIALQNVDLKVQRGYISRNQGARELGYLKAFRNDSQQGE